MVRNIETVVFWVVTSCIIVSEYYCYTLYYCQFSEYHCHTLYYCQWISLSHPVLLSVNITVTPCIIVSEYHCHTLYYCKWISLSHLLLISVNITVTFCIIVSEYHCHTLYYCQWISLSPPVLLSVNITVTLCILVGYLSLWHSVFLSGVTNFSEKHTASLFRYHPITWRQHVTFKRWHELQNSTVSQPTRSQSHHLTLSVFQ